MSADIRLCKRCRKMFRYEGEAVCRPCVAELDDVYMMVRDYVDSHFSASVKDIIKDTEVNERDVLMLLREGRFELNIPDGTITCQKCGKAITTGNICDACREKLGKTLKDYAEALKPKEPAKPSGTGRSKGMHVDGH